MNGENFNMPAFFVKEADLKTMETRPGWVLWRYGSAGMGCCVCHCDSRVRAVLLDLSVSFSCILCS